ncbi:hypothetical protein SRHO_G00064840 [Serrasalmus rhombeus]
MAGAAGLRAVQLLHGEKAIFFRGSAKFITPADRRLATAHAEKALTYSKRTQKSLSGLSSLAASVCSSERILSRGAGGGSARGARFTVETHEKPQSQLLAPTWLIFNCCQLHDFTCSGALRETKHPEIHLLFWVIQSHDEYPLLGATGITYKRNE